MTKTAFLFPLLLATSADGFMTTPSSLLKFSTTTPLQVSSGSRSVLQRPRPSTPCAPLRAATADGDELDFFDPSTRSVVRTAGIALVWASLVAYVAVGAPGRDEASQALDSDLLQKLIANPFDDSCPPFFTALFNFMGIWPAIYSALLLPGAANQKPVPAAPFVAGSVAFGMFALSPYLALREYRGADAAVTMEKLNGVSRWFEGKLNAALLSAGAVGLSAFALTAHSGDVARSAGEFQELFAAQLFPHVTSLDFLALWAFSFGVLAEDMDRRGMDKGAAPLFCAVPILGHCAYLLTRKPLPLE